MTLQEIIQVVDTLSWEELEALQKHINARRAEATPHEKADLLKAGFASLREGLTEEQLQEMTKAMNTEYIEQIDDDLWQG